MRLLPFVLLASLSGCVTWVRTEVHPAPPDVAGAEPVARLTVLLGSPHPNLWAPTLPAVLQTALQGPVAREVACRDLPLGRAGSMGAGGDEIAGLQTSFEGLLELGALDIDGPTVVVERGFVIPYGWGAEVLSVMTLGLWPVLAGDAGARVWRVSVVAGTGAPPSQFTIGYAPRRFTWLPVLAIWPFTALELVFRQAPDDYLAEVLRERLRVELAGRE